MAHLRNHDLRLVGLLRGLLPVLFPQPFFWLLRHIIRSSQEAVADAVAAEGRGCDYADGLIGWMRQVTGQKRMLALPVVGIWERPSELSGRIALLVGDQFTVHTNVSPRWRALAAVLTGALTLGLSALTVRPVSAGAVAQGSQTMALSATNSADTHALAVRSNPSLNLGITADHCVRDGNTPQVIFFGHVVVTNAQGRLSCERLTINSPARDSDDSHPTNAIAETNLDVIFIDANKGDTNHLTAGKGVYDYSVVSGITNETFTFTIHPTISNSHHRMIGTKLVWDTTAGSLEMHGIEMHDTVPANSGNGTNASPIPF